MMKKLVSLLVACILAVTLVFVLASCGKSNDDDGIVNPGAEIGGEIKIWWPGGSAAESAAIYEAKKQYEALHGNVKVTIVDQNSSNFYMDYMMALNGNDYPDLAYVDHVYVQQLVHENAIANLSANGMNSVKDTFIDSLWKPNSYGGDVYALPFSANVQVLAYNKVILNQVLGRETTDADIPKTYDEFKVIAQKILDYNKTNNTSYTPITIPAGTGNTSYSALAYLSYVSREGGKVISDDLKTVTLTNGPAENAAKIFREMHEKGYSTEVFEEGNFEAGKIAFIEMGSWKKEQYEILSKQEGRDFRYAPVFKTRADGESVSGLGLYSVVATRKSKNLVTALDFLKFAATSDELQLLHNKAQNLMPCTKTAIQDEFYTGEVWSVYREQLNRVTARPGTPVWAEMERQFAAFVTELLSGKRNPDYVSDLQYVLQNAIDEIYMYD